MRNYIHNKINRDIMKRNIRKILTEVRDNYKRKKTNAESDFELNQQFLDTQVDWSGLSEKLKPIFKMPLSFSSKVTGGNKMKGIEAVSENFADHTGVLQGIIEHCEVKLIGVLEKTPISGEYLAFYAEMFLSYNELTNWNHSKTHMFEIIFWLEDKKWYFSDEWNKTFR